jgi:nucleoside-diphosphate-sugar epimerase
MKSIKPCHILVTGGFGYVGSRLTPHLLELGHRVRVLDLMLYTDVGLDALKADPRYKDWSGRFELVRGDLRDEAAVRQALKDVDTVIHLGAISNDPTGEIDDTLTRQVNFDAIGMLLTLAKESGVRRFINGSSSSVFGIKKVADVTEELEAEPLTSYSRYKALSEWLVLAAAGPEFCAVNIRPATICGHSPRQRFDLTVNKLTADAVRKKLITIHGGQQRRPNVGISDAINLYALLTQVEEKLINGRTFNFGFENHTVLKIGEIIQDELKDLNVKLQITDTNDHRDYHISSEKIIKVLGYKPVSSIRAEVGNLRRALESGQFPDIDAPEHYNMKIMKLERNPGCYQFLARD